MLLSERSPRERTAVYTSHQFRAIAQHQLCWLLPSAVGIGFGLWTAVVALPYLPTDFAARFMGIVSLLIVVGLLTGMGTRAYWGLAGTRLLLALASNPQSPDAISKGYRLPAPPVFDEPGIVLGETHTTRDYNAWGDYELAYHAEEQFSPTPELAILPAKSLVTGLLVLGSIGSGKTAYVLKPSVFQLFHHASRPGGLVMDSKAALVEPLRAEMESAGRSEDFLAVGPDQPTKWNPLHQPLSEPSTVANSLVVALENVNGAPFSADTRWIRSGVTRLAEGIIGLLRLMSGYVTASAVRYVLSELQMTTAGSDTPGEVARQFITGMVAASGKKIDSTDVYFLHYSGLIVDCCGEDEKFRAIYVSECNNLLIPLVSPSVAHLYNAPEDELDMPDWSECINMGLVVVLDCNSRSVPGLAVILGMMLKLSYEDAMLARLDWVRDGRCNADRYMALIIDEYQDYCSPGDADYLALCRESKSISVFSTQGFASIIQRIGEDRAKVVLQSMRNRLVLNQTVPEFAADLLGQHEVEEINRNVSENVTAAALTSSGQFGGDSTVSESYSMHHARKHVIPPEELSSLPLGQCILQSHDGFRSTPLHRVYLRPHFVAPGTRHADLENK